MNLNILARKIRDINYANGWKVLSAWEWEEEDYKVPAILCLIHSEISEALEAYRSDDKEHFYEEMADVIIRVLDCVGAFVEDENSSIDFDKILMDKIEKNKTREYRHGNKRV
jgi:NTP pyrophosphatase (non-canonical NTP hydrolase)